MTLTPKALSIQDGQLDGDNHPFVALVVAYLDYVDDDGMAQHVPLWRGSGTLISPRVVVTAGHVVGQGPESGIVPTSMAVYFESDVRRTGYPYTGGYSGTPIPHPDWNGLLNLPNTHDIGVVVLDEGVYDTEVEPEYPHGRMGSFPNRGFLINWRLGAVCRTRPST